MLRNAPVNALPMARLFACVAGLCAARGAAADPCDVLYEASLKSLQTPHRVSSTTTHAGKTRTSEAIHAGGVEYVQHDGAWRRSPVTIAELVATAKENLATHPDVCAAAGSRTIDGRAVDVYSVHGKEAGTDQEVRVSKPSGLLQGSTMKLPNGDVIETRYDYADVRPPPGA